VPVADLVSLDVVRYGSLIRQHAVFAPHGTNVDFIKYCPSNRIQMRTYERGVEAESGACGTGAVAAAVIAIERGDFTLPVDLTTSTGFELHVDGDWRTRKCTGMMLTGPVKTVFEGVIDLDALSVDDGAK
jgi:diaminopimelate epimerase